MPDFIRTDLGTRSCRKGARSTPLGAPRDVSPFCEELEGQLLRNGNVNDATGSAGRSKHPLTVLELFIFCSSLTVVNPTPAKCLPWGSVWTKLGKSKC